MGVKANIKMRNKCKRSDNDEMRHSQSVINDLPLCYHDVVIIVRGNYHRYFEIITEEGENMKNLEQKDEIELNHLKKLFGKWVVTPRYLDSRLIAGLKKVTASVDSRCQYTITDV